MKTFSESLEEIKREAYKHCRDDVDTDHPNGINSLDKSFEQIKQLAKETILGMEIMKDEDYMKYEPHTDERYALDARNDFRKEFTEAIEEVMGK